MAGDTVQRALRPRRRIPVSKVSDFPDGAAIRLAPQTTGTADAIAVFNDGGRLYAINDTCTHAEGSLVDGWVADGEVECPLHGGSFCLGSGAALSLPATRNTVVHGVEIVDATVWLLPDDTPEPELEP
jgi:3-phenylpropionate/trans-cinnamate dioxygenase ferredoxin component